MLESIFKKYFAIGIREMSDALASCMASQEGGSSSSELVEEISQKATDIHEAELSEPFDKHTVADL